MFVNLLVSQDGGDKYYGKLLVENNLVLRLHIHRTIHMLLAQQEQISMVTNIKYFFGCLLMAMYIRICFTFACRGAVGK